MAERSSPGKLPTGHQMASPALRSSGLSDSQKIVSFPYDGEGEDEGGEGVGQFDKVIGMQTKREL
jgi:hypothetical protein